jgi:hypothetical protein
MAPVMDVVHGVSPAMADVLVASVWQSVLLTGVVAVAMRLVPRVPAGTRSGLWTAVLVLVVVLPVVSVFVPHTLRGDGRAVHLASDWSLWLVCLWAGMSLFRLVELCLSAARLRALARSAEAVEVDAPIARLLELGSRKVLLCRSELVDRPSVIGFFRPRILLSPELLGSLSQAELEQIVVHEMEHLRRRDHWTNLLQQVSVVVLPWNPAVLWLNRRLSLERELACDDGVMRATKARKTYAACLVRLAEESMLRRGISLTVRRGISLTLGALGAFEARARESELVRRVRRILTANEPGVAPGFLRVAMGAVLAGALGLSVLLARSPRLVEFGGGAATVAAAGTFEGPAVASNRADGRMDGARPTLVKAVMPDASGGRGVVRTSTLRRNLREDMQSDLGSDLHSDEVRHRARRVAQAPQAMEVQVWRERTAVVRPVLTLASAGDSQQLYAAVPWQGGWLLFQL